jgi:glutathione S-transferase
MQQISAALDKLEHDCGAPWFFGGKMTQADITAGCLVGYMKMRVPDMFPADKYPKLHRLALHCESMEDFMKARPSPGETVPGQTRE